MLFTNSFTSDNNQLFRQPLSSNPSVPDRRAWLPLLPVIVAVRLRKAHKDAHSKRPSNLHFRAARFWKLHLGKWNTHSKCMCQCANSHTLVQITHDTCPNCADHPQVNIHWINCIENFFTVQDFWATRACPEKQSSPWNFSLYWIYFYYSGIQLSRRHACPLLGIAPLLAQVSSSLLAVREIKVSFSAVALRLSYLKWQFFSHDVMDTTCAFQEHWNLFWNDVHAVYLSLLQKYLIRFHRKGSSRLKEPQLKSLPSADNNWLTQIPCEFCNRYDWYRCVSRILKNKKRWKSSFSRSAVSSVHTSATQ